MISEFERLEPAAVETALAALVLDMHPNAQRVDGSGGDGGADLVEHLPDGVRVFEIKSFTSRLDASRKRQVTSSLARAVANHPGLVAWTLVLPMEFTPKEQVWFRGLAARAPGVAIDWFGLTRIQTELAKRPFLQRAHLPWSPENRALQLLAQWHQEQAAMPRVLDALPRAQALHELARDVDPDFRVERITSADGGTQLELTPRRPLERPPVRSLTVWAPAGSEQARMIEDYRLYGTELELPGEYVADLDIDLPGEIGRLFEGARATRLSAVPVEEQPVAVQVELRAGGTRVGRRGLDLVRTAVGPAGGGHIRLEDRDRVFSLQLRQGPTLPDGTPSLLNADGLVLDVRIGDQLLPGDVLAALEFLAGFAQADELEVLMPDRRRIAGKLRGVPDMFQPLVLNRDVARALDFVQTNTGSIFPLPTTYSPDDLFVLNLSESLLRDGSATVDWAPAAVNVTVPSARAMLAAAPFFPRIDCRVELNSKVMFAGNPIDLPRDVEVVADGLVVLDPPRIAAQLRDRALCSVQIELVADGRSCVTARWAPPD